MLLLKGTPDISGLKLLRHIGVPEGEVSPLFSLKRAPKKVYILDVAAKWRSVPAVAMVKWTFDMAWIRDFAASLTCDLAQGMVVLAGERMCEM
jgi:hypothetical protein